MNKIMKNLVIKVLIQLKNIIKLKTALITIIKILIFFNLAKICTIILKKGLKLATTLITIKMIQFNNLSLKRKLKRYILIKVLKKIMAILLLIIQNMNGAVKIANFVVLLSLSGKGMTPLKNMLQNLYTRIIQKTYFQI